MSSQPKLANPGQAVSGPIKGLYLVQEGGSMCWDSRLPVIPGEP